MRILEPYSTNVQLRFPPKSGYLLDKTKIHIYYVFLSNFSDVFFYDLKSEKWQELPSGLPTALQGSCSVAFNETILIVGGKNEAEFPWGSNLVWPFDPVNGSFGSQSHWPEMRFQRYYQGCALIEYKGALSKSGLSYHLYDVIKTIHSCSLLRN